MGQVDDSVEKDVDAVGAEVMSHKRVKSQHFNFGMRHVFQNVWDCLCDGQAYKLGPTCFLLSFLKKHVFFWSLLISMMEPTVPTMDYLVNLHAQINMNRIQNNIETIKLEIK